MSEFINLFIFLMILNIHLVYVDQINFKELEIKKLQTNCIFFKGEEMLGNNNDEVLINTDSCLLCKDDTFFLDLGKCYKCSEYFPNCSRCNSFSCTQCKNENHILISFENIVLQDLSLEKLNLSNVKNKLLVNYSLTKDTKVLLESKDTKICYNCLDEIENLNSCENCLSVSASSIICSYCPTFYVYDHRLNRCMPCSTIMNGCNKCIDSIFPIKYARCFDCNLPYIMVNDVCICRGGYLSLSNNCFSITIIIILIVSIMIIFIIFIKLISKFIKHLLGEEEINNELQVIQIDENAKLEKSIIKFNVAHNSNCIFCNKELGENFVLKNYVNKDEANIKMKKNNELNEIVNNINNDELLSQNNQILNKTFCYNNINSNEALIQNKVFNSFSNESYKKEKIFEIIKSEYIDQISNLNKIEDLNQSNDIYYYKSFCGGLICSICITKAMENIDLGYFDKCKSCNSLIIGLYDENQNDISIIQNSSLKEDNNIKDNNLESIKFENNKNNGECNVIDINDVKVNVSFHDNNNNDKKGLNDDFNLEKCPVCLGYNVDCTIPCDFKPWHKIHKHCLKNMVNKNVKNCPICRSNLML